MAPYHIQSKNTLFYVISTDADKPGQKVDTKPGKNSIPPNSTLNVSPIVEGTITVATIKGVNGLYVSLVGDAENTKLTWSPTAYLWNVTITQTGPETYYVTPATGQDLYWFDEFSVGVGNHIEVRFGKDIRPPQSEWIFTRVLVD